MVISLSLPLRPERDQQKWTPVLRPIARQILRERMIWSPNRPHFGGSCARHGHSIFIGFPHAALTFLNRPGGFLADAPAGLRQMWEASSENGRADFTKSCAVARGPGIS
jgi:hypothetical protein